MNIKNVWFMCLFLMCHAKALLFNPGSFPDVEVKNTVLLIFPKRVLLCQKNSLLTSLNAYQKVFYMAVFINFFLCFCFISFGWFEEFALVSCGFFIGITWVYYCLIIILSLLYGINALFVFYTT